ncbi:hydroxyacid dehydrogenase [Kitasatospora sp. cg17-2]
MTPNRPAAVLAMSPASAEMILHPTVLARLQSLTRLAPAIVTDFHDPAHTAALARAELLFTCWGCPVLDASALDRMPRLRAVVHAAGTVRGHITDDVWHRDIAVTTAADANAVPVAEYTVAAVLAAGKRIGAVARIERDRAFDRERWQQYFPTWGNYRTTVGIVGASRIGRRVIELLRPFDLDVLVADPYLTRAPAGSRLADLDELAATAHVVSLHAPELPTTRHMFDRRRLALMPDGATLVNTARGALVDTRALTDELASGRLHAVLDVTDPEPLPRDHPLRSLPNVLLTPHIAGSFGNELERMAHAAADEVERHTRGQPFRGAVRPEDLAHSA